MKKDYQNIAKNQNKLLNVEQNHMVIRTLYK